jgi:hypothetical protein
MATSTAPLDQTSDSGFRLENTDYKVYVKYDADNKVEDVKTVSKNFSAFEEKNPDFQLIVEQTVAIPRVTSLKGIMALMADDEDEAVAIFTRGLNQKISLKFTDGVLKEVNEAGDYVFTPTEGVLDITDIVRETTSRRAATPLDKVAKALKQGGFSKEDIDRALAALMS